MFEEKDFIFSPKKNTENYEGIVKKDIELFKLESDYLSPLNNATIEKIFKNIDQKSR